jgi:hydrogenase expression/formation protein HypC
MCIAIPSLVTALHDMSATVECFGRSRNVSMVLMTESVVVGDYVLIQSGSYVVERVDRESALQTLFLLEQLLSDRRADEALAQPLGLSALET